MKVGGKRTLIIPAEKAYGARAVGANIPSNSALIFDVELVCVGTKGCEKQFRSKSERKAREERDAAEQWQREAPARQARQLCEAQKQTCFAICPPRAEGFRADSSARAQCVIRCENISCN